jgi:hypothetical protein
MEFINPQHIEKIRGRGGFLRTMLVSAEQDDKASKWKNSKVKRMQLWQQHNKPI